MNQSTKSEESPQNISLFFSSAMAATKHKRVTPSAFAGLSFRGITVDDEL
jgi:hypothetical protein